MTIAGGFLTVRSHPVADNLMRNPTITNELHREGTMFQNRFMPTLDDPGNECRGAGVCDLGFRLIANPPTLFKRFRIAAPSIGVINSTSALIIFMIVHPLTFQIPIYTSFQKKVEFRFLQNKDEDNSFGSRSTCFPTKCTIHDFQEVT